MISRTRLKCTRSSIGASTRPRDKGREPNMSVQFGRWNFNGRPGDRDYLEKVKPVIAAYGPDVSGSFSKTSISILYGAFHTTKESRREKQPPVSESRAVNYCIGPLDNRAKAISHVNAFYNI